MPLKELEVKYAGKRQKPYKLSDGGGLHLLVQPNGSKLWRLKYRFGGKEKLLSFGKYPDVSLAAARQRRDSARTLLAEGSDPSLVAPMEEEESSVRSFEVIARQWHANREEGLNPAHAQRVLSRMERDVFPAIGAWEITKIKTPEILAMIRKVEARGALDISRRIKQGVSQVFRFAIANGWAEHDPTMHLLGALKPKPRVQHMARVPMKELPGLVRGIANYDGDESPRCREITRDALMFTLLTWARTSETRFATWAEFEGLNGPEPLWRISAERMKMGREHLVSLSAQAVAILKRRRLETKSEYVFTGSKKGQPISENTMIYACYRMGYRRRQTVHGFRGLASTWANEAQCYQPDWIEMALAHSDENEVRGAYNSALYMEPRRTMLQQWANMIESVSENRARIEESAQVGVEQDKMMGRLEQSDPKLPASLTDRGLRLVSLDGVRC